MALNFVEEVQLENSITKLEVILQQERALAEGLSSTLHHLTSNYQTDNTNKFLQLSTELSNTSKVIKNEHQADTVVLSKTLTNYRLQARKTEQKFGDIV